MSDPDSNPFADPRVENPFADPSITSATSTTTTKRGLEEYNPFANQGAAGTNRSAPSGSQQTSTPAVIETRSEPPPPPYTDLMDEEQENLKKRQEELERKAAELQAKEQELRQMQYATRENNFPPLPSKFCCKACFYHDIGVEIPLEYQRTCKMLFYLWIFYTFTLLWNVIGSIAYMIGSSGAAVQFGVSILYVVLFVPCSFCLWYWPTYKAFRDDSSFNFMVFFFCFFFQTIFCFLYSLGLPDLGTCGWINAAGMLDMPDKSGHIPVAMIMFSCATLFTINGILMVIMLKRIHHMYRTAGASLEKAQQEFAGNVMTNPTVQGAAVNAATSGMKAGMSGNRK